MKKTGKKSNNFIRKKFSIWSAIFSQSLIHFVQLFAFWLSFDVTYFGKGKYNL